MALQLLIGNQAQQQMACGQFIERWQELYIACAWATPFQSPHFAQTWFEYYCQDFELILVFIDDGDRLAHLLVLAQSKLNKSVVHIGAQQAEYQCWLSYNEDFNDFLVTAMRQLKHITPYGKIELKFLPSQLNELIVKAPRLLNLQHAIRQEHQPLVHFESERAPWLSLRKKSNKSKLSRLRKLGEVAIDLVNYTYESELESLQCLEQIQTVYDMRQGGINGCLPFTQDVYKQAFTQQLLIHNDNVQVLKLTLNDKLIASIIGVVSQNQFSVAIFSYDPLFAKHSPGKLLILMGSELLAQRGLTAIDLTPGGQWKSRYANTQSQVAVISLFTNSTAYVKYVFKESLIRQSKKLLALCHFEPKDVRQLLSVLTTASSKKREVINECQNIYLISRDGISKQSDCSGVRVNQLADFVAFSKVLSTDEQGKFLRRCLARFESGATGYSIIRDGEVTLCGWLIVDTTVIEEDVEHNLSTDIYGVQNNNKQQLESLINIMVCDFVDTNNIRNDFTLSIDERLLSHQMVHALGFTLIETLHCEKHN